MKAFSDLSPQDWKSGTEDNNALIIDVRTAAEFGDSFISGAVNIEYGIASFQNHLADLDKSRSCFIYCRSGNRSSKAMAIMKEMEFQSVFNLEGGILAWEYKGFEVEYGDDF